MILKQSIILVLLIVYSLSSKSQILPPDTAFNPKKLSWVLVSESALVAGSLSGLYITWYSGYSSSKFHFFNDNAEWLQMDKIGHATTGYFFGKIGYDMLRFSGVSESKSIWYGGTVGFFYLSAVEVLDGFSSGWGASSGDIIANAFGTALFVVQQKFWHEQRITMKWSYHTTQFPQYRPNVLGKNILETALKDYNGQTYWLSANIYSFLPPNSKFPTWLNLGIGYGADGLLGGFSNPSEVNGVSIPNFERQRQFYISLDVDFNRIKFRRQSLKTTFNLLSFMKLPFPAIEFQGEKQRIKPFYF